MRRLLFILAAGGLALGFSVPALAIDAPTFNCEKTTVVELTKVSRARGLCIRKCLTKKQTKPTLSCSPPFDVGTGSTQDCADKTLDKYAALITAKCTGHMPPCGGYEKGWCSNNTSLSCNRSISDCPGTCNIGTNLCTHDNATPCTVNAECAGTCDGRCSTTTTLACQSDLDCPGVEQCVSAGVPKDIPQFITSNLYDGSPLGPIDQVDAFGETLFGCRQKVCTGSGDLCLTNADCPVSESCSSGECSNGAPCDYDGQCGTGTTKKCIALGRCSITAQSCRLGVATDCPGGETCDRLGRCGGGTNNQEACQSIADCPDATGSCVRTLVDTDRKAELKCSNAVQDALGKFTFDIANCQAKCAQERDQKDGQRCTNDTTKKCKVDGDCGAGTCLPTSCDPFATGRCSNNLFQVCTNNGDCSGGGICNAASPVPISGSLKLCRDKAQAKALAFINSKCPSLPVCGGYWEYGSPIGNLRHPIDLVGFVTTFQDGQFKEDDPDLGAGSNFCLQ